MITEFKKYENKLYEDINNILVIVDVQKEFKKFIPKNFVQKLTEYAKHFSTVYQIWDSNNAKTPSYSFPNEVDTIIKKYGTSFSLDLKIITKDITDQYPNASEGDRFKLKDTKTYIVRVNNNHKWFYVNKELSELFEKLKGKNIILVGGGDSECLKDVFIAMKSFGVNVQYNYKFIYSAKTNNKMTI